MIRLTKLSKSVFYLNPSMIEYIEETPDTVITMKDGKKFIVMEKASEIVDLFVEYYSRTYVRSPKIIDRESDSENLSDYRNRYERD